MNIPSGRGSDKHMGQDSKIEWTHHTFNPWRGCVKVSPGCANCYAETLSKRWGHDIWGVNKPRIVASESYWRQPLKWNRDAKEAGERRRVFCASMADVFEGHPDLQAPRDRLWSLIEETPCLDWLLLTKRPENIRRFFPVNREWANVWLGTSVEDQRRADERIPHLLDTPAKVHFLSCEPLLGGLNLTSYLEPMWVSVDKPYPPQRIDERPFPTAARLRSRVDWVIAGGESGHGARPMHPDWARSLRDQCQVAGVPFFFKQWGEWREFGRGDSLIARGAAIGCWRGDQWIDGEWWADGITMKWFGKKAAGRLLDGREWNEYPQP